jgi:sterol desaturase/sphingolipid hydroxylase (fatty acid hydroxylase superfamily)
MHILISEPGRLLMLIAICTFLWTLESIIPLYRYKNNRLMHAIPNLVLTVVLLLTNLALSFTSAFVASFVTQHHLGLFELFQFSLPLRLAGGLVGLDLFTYTAHVLLHKSEFGWRVHRVHHSENQMDVTTTFRQHPVETVWRILWQLAAVVVFGLPLWVVVVYLTLSSLNALMEHANIRYGDRLDWFLRLLIVTPNMHKIHHSREQRQTDSNYSNIFSMWDRIFGTYTRRVDFQRLRYGLDGFDDKAKHTLSGLLKMPFVRYTRVID